MKKLKFNKKGFAMAELLAVCIIVLTIFTILFSNYLPLAAEYENRVNYNDTTAQYASHYIRKAYAEAIEKTKNNAANANIETVIKNSLSSKYITIFKDTEGSNVETIFSHMKVAFGTGSQTEKDLVRLIQEYEIEEIIITKYQLTDIKSNLGQASGYPKTGLLYGYINYLPKYEKSIYTGANSDTNKELYRIILKTKSFGYATSPILYDYSTPGECFRGKSVTGGIEITEYRSNESDQCTDVVTISNKNITVRTNTGSRITGKIVSIGEEAFMGKTITEISYPSTVKTIGNRAFKNTKLESFEIGTGITSIGEEALYNTSITKLSGLKPTIKYGNRAFANNTKLQEIDLTGATKYVTSTGAETVGLFQGSGTGISVSIPNTMTSIGNDMFKDCKINNIDIGTGVKTIGSNAFSGNKGSIASLNIPDSVTTIGASAFYNSKIKSLSFAGSGSLTLSTSSFASNSLTSINFGTRKITTLPESVFANNTGTITTLTLINNITKIETKSFYKTKITNLSIPDSITEIGSQAFKESNITSLSITENSKLTKIGTKAFYNNPNLKTFVVPKLLTTIESNAFGKCTLLGSEMDNIISNYSASQLNWCDILYDDNINSCTTSTHEDDQNVTIVKISDEDMKYINKIGGESEGGTDE